MTTEEARRLLPETVVMWDGNPNDLGTVVKFNFSGFYVDWADGQRGWIDYKDAEKVSIR
jgi:hypothetical protein